MEIGEMIRQVLMERGISVTEFAGMLSCSRENAHRIMKKSVLDTELLMRISEALEHDFFRDISENSHIARSDSKTES